MPHRAVFPSRRRASAGIDVHDMEDLGDLVGYEEGRCRSDRLA